MTHQARLALIVSCLTVSGIALVSPACGGEEGLFEEPVRMVISPSDLSLTEGTSGLLSVGVSGGKQGAVLPTVRSCVSASPAVATAVVEGSGCRVTAVAVGNTTVTATLTDNQARAANVTVAPLPPALTGVTLPGGAILVGQSLALLPSPVVGGAAVAVSYSYASSASSIASVNSATGLVTGVAQGTATIIVTATATGAGFRATTLTASATIAVSPLPPALTGLTVSGGSLLVGAVLPLAPGATLGGGGVSVTYTYSSNAVGVATVNAATGLVAGVSPGTAVIAVTAVGSGAGFSTTSLTANATVVVNALPAALTGVTILPSGGALMIGELLRLSANAVPAGAGVTVTLAYASSAPTVASVNATTGVVTGVAQGSASITVSATGSGSGFSTIIRTASAAITVSASTLGIGFGSEQFAAVPPGTYSRGSLTGNSDELPVRSISLSGFSVQKTELTQAQWRQVMTGTAIANPSGFTACGETCPVENTSWADVQLFLTRLNTQDPGKGYRLPTEAEWEYVTRAGTSGDVNVPGQPVENIAWISSNSGGRTSRVGGKLPNAFGLYDTLGNVWEWVTDWYDATYYATGPVVNPPGPTVAGTDRVIRGSSWFFGAQLARSSLRERFPPTSATNALGFRLVRN